MALEINFRLQARIRRDEETATYVTWCPALNVRSQGTSEVEARRALSSAITMYIKHCYQRKILDNLLNEHGFDPVTREDALLLDGTSDESNEQTIVVREIDTAPRPQYDHSFTIDVPLHLTRGGPRSQRSAESAVCQ